MDASSRTEQQLEEIEKQIAELESVAGDNKDAQAQLTGMHAQVAALRKQVYANLGPWQRTELARHSSRPYTLDYVQHIFSDFSEIHGDRAFGDDPAIVCGMASFHGEQVLVVGQQKGRDTKQKLYRNFGMPGPEGYRKALRVMRMAQKWRRPIFAFVDTPGAYPGLGAEERGQAEAIARNLLEMSRLPVPIIVTVTGEGGSGGALGIAVGDRILMLENSVYSVISPEGCASIMWRDVSKRELAAAAMKITAPELKEFGIIDEIVPEPQGGAHNDQAAMAKTLDEVLQRSLREVRALTLEQMLDARYNKFRNMAQFYKES
jgi:acetyl-CoA carboxylase carboxyl transferase subunit alpha